MLLFSRFHSVNVFLGHIHCYRQGSGCKQPELKRGERGEKKKSPYLKNVPAQQQM